MPTIKYDQPSFSGDEAVAEARRIYSLETAAKPLPSERDQNFLLTTASGERFVLKISNAVDDPQVLDLQNQALMRLAALAPHLALPRVQPTRDSAAIITLPDARSTAHPVQLLT